MRVTLYQREMEVPVSKLNLVEEFQSSVSDWRTKAEVSASPVLVDPSAGFLFPAEPLLADSDHFTDQQVDVVRLYSVFSFLEYFIWLEQALVPPTCRTLRQLGLPSYLTDVLASIEVQEQHHSSWAYELELGIQNATGVACPFVVPAALESIAEAVGLVPNDLRPLVVAFSLVIAEVLDFGTAAKIANDPALNPAVREFAYRHEVEERLHRVYFRNVLTELWRLANPDERRSLRSITSPIAAGLVRPDVAWFERAFAAAGISTIEARQAGEDSEVSIRIHESLSLVE